MKNKPTVFHYLTIKNYLIDIHDQQTWWILKKKKKKSFWKHLLASEKQPFPKLDKIPMREVTHYFTDPFVSAAHLAVTSQGGDSV